jgi:hypothetical protein
VCTLAGFDIVPQTVELTMASSPLPVTGYTIHGPSTVAATKRVANTSAAEYYAKDSNDKVATTGV